MGKQRPSTIKSQCTKVTASDRTLLSLSRILFHSNYSKVSTANLMQIMSEAVISSTEENSSSCIYRFPLTICTPAYAQTISLCDHYYKSRKFLKTKQQELFQTYTQKTRNNAITQGQRVSNEGGGDTCASDADSHLSALLSPCVGSSLHRIGKTG